MFTGLRSGQAAQQAPERLEGEGLVWSMPMLWATNVLPQMTAASRSSRLPYPVF
jgi:hypothetical protein